MEIFFGSTTYISTSRVQNGYVRLTTTQTSYTLLDTTTPEATSGLGNAAQTSSLSWFLTSSDRNKLQHILNGNIPPSPDETVRRQHKQPPLTLDDTSRLGNAAPANANWRRRAALLAYTPKIVAHDIAGSLSRFYERFPGLKHNVRERAKLAKERREDADRRRAVSMYTSPHYHHEVREPYYIDQGDLIHVTPRVEDLFPRCHIPRVYDEDVVEYAPKFVRQEALWKDESLKYKSFAAVWRIANSYDTHLSKKEGKRLYKLYGSQKFLEIAVVVDTNCAVRCVSELGLSYLHVHATDPSVASIERAKLSHRNLQGSITGPAKTAVPKRKFVMFSSRRAKTVRGIVRGKAYIPQGSGDLDPLSTISEIVTSSFEKLQIPILDYLEQYIGKRPLPLTLPVFSMLETIYNTESKYSRILAIVALMTTEWFKVNIGVSFEAIMNMVESAVDMSHKLFDPSYVPQGEGDDDPSYNAWYNRVRHSRAVVAGAALIYQLFLCVTGLLPEHMSLALVQFGEWFSSTVVSPASVIDLIIQYATYMKERITEAIASGNIMDIFEGSPEVRALEQIQEAHDLLNRNNEDSRNLSPREIAIKVEHVINKHLSFRNANIKTCVTKLIDALSDYRANTAVERVRPVGIILTGIPGTGKSVFAGHLERIYKAKHGIPADVNISHTETETKHQKLGVKVDFYIINDAFQRKEEYMDASVLSRLQQLVDTTPYSAETASISDKDNARITPKFVIVSTNNSTYDLAQSVNGANKLDRRYMVVQFNVDPKHLDAFKTAATSGKYLGEHISYTVGYMNNADDAKIKIAPELNAWSTKDINKVFHYFMDCQDVNEKAYKPCENCRGTPCSCAYIKSYAKKEEIVQQGAVTSRLNARINNACDSVYDRMINEVKRKFGPVPPMTLPVLKYLIGITCITLTLTSLKLLRDLCKNMFQSSTPLDQQGQVLTLPITNTDLGSADGYVRPYINTSTPWLGNRDSVEVWDMILPMRMHVTFVSGDIAVFPLHALRVDGANIPIDTPMYLRSPKGIEHREKYNPNRVFQTPSGLDLVFYQFNNVSSLPPITSDFLPRVASLPKREPHFRGRLVDVKQEGRHISYSYETEQGDCGLPLRDATGCVFSIHVGIYPNSKRGVGVPICLNDVVMARKHFNTNSLPISPQGGPMLYDIPMEEGTHPNSDASWLARINGDLFLPRANHIAIGHFARFDRPRLHVHATMMRVLFPECEDHAAPYTGKARPNEEGEFHSPVVKRLRAGQVVPNPSEYLLDMVVQAYTEHIPAPEVSLAPWQLQTVLVGSPVNTFANAKDTSKAIGMGLKSKGITKRNAFTKNDDDSWTIHPDIVSGFNDLDALVRGDGPLPVSWVKATMKEEALSMSKVLNGKGRLFYVSDVVPNLLLKKYVCPILSFFREIIAFSKMVVTINAGSNDWHGLVGMLSANRPEPLSETDECYIAGDQKEYDLRHQVLLRHYVHFMKIMAIKCGYSPEDVHATVRILLLHETYLLNLMDDIFLCKAMWCSGRSDTIDGNCIMNVMIHAYAFTRYNTSDPSRYLVVAREYFIKVNMAVTGDDVVVCSDPKLCPGAAYQSGATELGYELTREDKTEGPLEYKPITAINYLKRGFVLHEGKYRAPLDVNSIYKMLCYYSGRMSPSELVSRNINTVLCAQREAYLHGPKMFDMITDRIKDLDFLKETTLYTYQELDDEYIANIFQVWENFVRSTNTALVDTNNISYDESLKKLRAAVTDGDYVTQGISRKAGYLNIGDTLSSKITMELCDSIEAATNCMSGEICQHTKLDIASCGYTILNCTTETTLNYNSALTEELRPEPIAKLGVTNEDTEVVQTGIVGLRVPTEGAELSKFWERPRLLYTWDIATTHSGDLFSTWQAIPEVTSMIKQWALFRGNAKLMIHVTGSSQYMGKARIYVYPKRYTGTYEYALPTTNIDPGLYTFNYATTSQLPHVDIDMSMAQEYTLELPYPVNREYIDIGSESDWSLYVAPINNLKLANGNTPGTLLANIFISYSDVALERIIPQGIDPDADRKYISMALNYGSIIASKVGGLWSTPLSIGLKAGSEIASYFGYSKTPIEPTKTIVTRKFGNPNLASGQGDVSYSLGLDPAVSRNCADVIPMTNPGDDNFGVYFSRQTQLIRVWSPTTQVEITPGVCAGIDVGSAFWQTSLAHGAAMFQYWSGSIKVCIEVISSPLVRWRIGVVIVPPGVAAPVTFPSSGFITHIIECVGTTCHDLEVPYLYLAPFREFTYNKHITINGVNETRLMYFPLIDATGPSATPVVPEVNLWISGGSDFTVGVPDLRQVNEYAIVTQGYVPQGGTDGRGLATFGEMIETPSYLCHRVCPVVSGSTNSVSLDKGVFMFPVQPLTVGPITPFDMYAADLGEPLHQMWTYVTWLESAHLGCTGQYVYKVSVGNTDSVNAHTFMNVYESFLLVIDSLKYAARGSLMHLWRESPYAELRAPDRNPYRFRQAGNCYHATQAGKRYETFLAKPQEQSADVVTHEFTVWVGTADDYKLGGFLCAPPIRPS